MRAENQARIATARELAAAAVANLDVDPERSILLAVEALDERGRRISRPCRRPRRPSTGRCRSPGSCSRWSKVAGSPLSGDGSRFATTGEDGTAIVWETDTGRRLLTLRGHEGVVNGIAYSPDGSLLATTGDDRTARLWDAASGRQIHVLRGHRDLVLGAAFSPDGRLLATSSQDGTVRIWNVAAGTQRLVLRGPPDETFVSFYRPHPRLQP